METKIYNSNDFHNIYVGMFWYQDNTFSETKIPNKKVKAIVEMVNNGTIYGDLTASELIPLEERNLCWKDAKEYIQNMPYACQKDEHLVLYNHYQMFCLIREYPNTISAWKKLGKEARWKTYWIFDDPKEPKEFASREATATNFTRAQDFNLSKTDPAQTAYIRPVLALKVK